MNNPKLMVKHLLGWLSTDTMNNKNWFAAWYLTAVEAEKENTVIAVFKITGRTAGERSAKTEYIEEYLQRCDND